MPGKSTTGRPSMRRLGASEEAAKSYERALALAGNDSERRFLGRRLLQEQASL